MTTLLILAAIAAAGLACRHLIGRAQIVGRICQDDGRLPIVCEPPAGDLVQDDIRLSDVGRRDALAWKE